MLLVLAKPLQLMWVMTAWIVNLLMLVGKNG
jgi:hypothetical protein